MFISWFLNQPVEVNLLLTVILLFFFRLISFFDGVYGLFGGLATHGTRLAIIFRLFFFGVILLFALLFKVVNGA